MKKFIQTMIQWIWGLPQNIMGLVLFLFFAIKNSPNKKYNHAIVSSWKYRSGLSLGMFIFVPPNVFYYNFENDYVRHEYGHSLQSLILGIFWLFIIGLPSVVWAGCFGKWREKHQKSYYWLYCEKWANNLGRAYNYNIKTINKGEAHG